MSIHMRCEDFEGSKLWSDASSRILTSFNPSSGRTTSTSQTAVRNSNAFDRT